MKPAVASIPILLACRMVTVAKGIPNETQLGADSYPLHRRKSFDNCGQLSNISMRIEGFRVDQETDNKWIVLYNKLLLIHKLPL